MDILTPFQKQILTAVGHSPLKPSFYLTGDTALAAYYLQHRYSEDLDFFTDSQEAVPGVAAIMNDIAHELGVTAEFTRTFPITLADLQAYFLNLAKELMASVDNSNI